MKFQCQVCEDGFDMEDTVEVEIEDETGELATGWVCLDCYNELQWVDDVQE